MGEVPTMSQVGPRRMHIQCSGLGMYTDLRVSHLHIMVKNRMLNGHMGLHCGYLQLVLYCHVPVTMFSNEQLENIPGDDIGDSQRVLTLQVLGLCNNYLTLFFKSYHRM